MDNFNSKDFYGNSLTNDPKLRTTTRNYEFKYNSSNRLDQIINRVKMDRAKKKSQLSNFKRLCAPFDRAESLFLFEDLHVERHIGRAISRDTVVKVMTDEEIDAMIAQAFHSPKVLPVTNEETQQSHFAGDHYDPADRPTKDIPQNLKQKEAKIAISSVEIQTAALQPQWVEITPTKKAIRNITETREAITNESFVSPSHEDFGLPDVFALNLSNERPEINGQDTDPDEDDLFDAVSHDSFSADDLILRNEDLTHRTCAESTSGSIISIGLDLPLNNCEHAEMERVLGKTLPYIPEMNFDEINSTDVSESECCDYLNDQEQDDDVEQDSFRSENIEQSVEPIIRIQKTELLPKPIQSPARTPPSLLISPSPTAPTQRSYREKAPSTTTFKTKEKAPVTPHDKGIKRQIDSLKHEKIRIFSKMTSIQEKIVETLDKLRMSLLELSLPDGNVEQKLRERNAFEFSVRFSRNYLFPLGRMIEHLKTAPMEDFCSATTNEPCVKVCGIYGLLGQALECYYKQLRHFFTDSVPKKLDIIITMITDTTNICLKKKIFDKRDTLIQILLLRCSTFLEFFVELTEQKKSVREKQFSARSARRDQFKLRKTSSKWYLTMNLNSLNMYEPKLVAKPKIKPPKKTKPLLSTRMLKPKEEEKKKEKESVLSPAPDPIDTQVHRDAKAESVQLINQALEEQPNSDLTKTVIETLQDITKDEIRQMLKPIVSNLDSIFSAADNPQSVESVLGVLNLRLLEQLNIDAAATENSTQNGNTYQNEVTKKGAETDSRKGELLCKEDRQKRVSKTTKATSSSNNVKEGSTEQTERYNSRDGLTDTVCDKQSLSNIDVVTAAAVAVVGKSDSMKQKTHSRSGVGGCEAFLSATAAAAAVNKPTPNRIGLPPPVQLDEVMPPPLPRTQQTAQALSKRMTSQCLEYSAASLSAVDESTPQQGIAVGYPKNMYMKTIPSQGKVSDGDGDDNEDDDDDANAFNGAEGRKEEARRRYPKSNHGTTMSGQMEQLNYSTNALYTFVKYCDAGQHVSEVETSAKQTQNVPKVASPAVCYKSSQTEVFETMTELNRNTNPNPNTQKQAESEIQNEEDIKLLLEGRKRFIEQCKIDPLYTNPMFLQPWKVLSKISHSIAREIVENIEENLSFGEESYVRDFINMELQQ